MKGLTKEKQDYFGVFFNGMTSLLYTVSFQCLYDINSVVMYDSLPKYIVIHWRVNQYVPPVCCRELTAILLPCTLAG